MVLNRFMGKIAVPAVLLIASNSAFASTTTLDEFYKHFKSAHYQDALNSLEKHTDSASKAYLSGLSYSRMQEYDKAVSEFKKAVDLKSDAVDLYYEYGQALYAANEMRKSREAFRMSAEKKFNRAASLYYVAHISQILEEYETAKDYYTQVLKEKDLDQKMRQIATFQIAETLLSIAREKSNEPADLNRRVEKFILPLMQKGFDVDKSTALAADIRGRMTELMKEFNLDPDLLINGRRISPKRYQGYFAQKIKFDDNISLINEENNIQQSKKESYVFETEAYGKYDFVAQKRFVISPEARLTFTEHSDRSSPEVYQNDTFVMNFNLKNKYEHKYKEAPASALFDIDFSRTLKDYNATKKREFYANSLTFTLGESLGLFSFGDTTFKVKRKQYSGHDDLISNHTTSLSADQIVFLPIQHLLIALFDASFIDNYNNPTTNTNTFLTRLDYIIPEIAPSYTLGLGLAYTITDTKEMKATRGTETSFNPSIDLSKELTARSKLSVNYDYTKTSSNDTNYAYNKSVFTTEYRFSF